ncbi:sugar kinase [Salibacterium qingdaonense]|uniref:2-dehydro-3-deoxygluconokinase n=1 Tax=Salibacterium qingdaonense TaxID=266892 RepID=A0A1I4LDJ8_9BACI|nr:sugar kinase [Salibacterium qingdaonense]SFL89000.1 2-dehydro-3-deoxygluconokinase [Salibacterium qingdaonense]
MMLDVISIGDAMITMNPKSRGPLMFSHEFERKMGGAELNLIVGCARLGLQPGWISRFGQDGFGRYILNYMRGEGVDVSRTKLLENYRTPLNIKEVLEDGSGSTFYYRFPSPTEDITPADMEENYLKQARVFYISGVFLSLAGKNLDIIKKGIQIAKKHNRMVALDPNIRLKLWSREQARETMLPILPDVDIMMSGKEEADLLFGEQPDEAHLETFGQYGISYVALKKGGEGASGWFSGEGSTFVPPESVKVVDTVGAGDGFNAGFLYSILRGFDLKRSLRFANTVGAMVTGVSGDNEGLPYLESVQTALGERQHIER